MVDLMEDPYKEYIPEKEPTKEALEYAWTVTNTLNHLDGIEMSEYLQAEALSNINGEITLEEVGHKVAAYYADRQNDKYKNADFISFKTAVLLSVNAFSFCVPQYIGIHRYLYKGIDPDAGILSGDSKTREQQTHCRTSEINILEHVISEERQFNYSLYDIPEMISHLSGFASRLRQIHAFEKGNNRINAVFLLKYLQTNGLDSKTYLQRILSAAGIL